MRPDEMSAAEQAVNDAEERRQHAVRCMEAGCPVMIARHAARLTCRYHQRKRREAKA